METVLAYFWDKFLKPVYSVYKDVDIVDNLTYCRHISFTGVYSYEQSNKFSCIRSFP
jgi:hypothetical protein